MSRFARVRALMAIAILEAFGDRGLRFAGGYLLGGAPSPLEALR